MVKNISKKKSNVRKPRTAPSLAKKQKELNEGTVETLTTKSNLYGIWLVRQGLRMRSEQYLAVAESEKDAKQFCRLFHTPLYCRENNSKSLGLSVENSKINKVNYDNSHLLIKGIDFNRRETGRTNQSPLWYLVIAPIPIVRQLDKLAKAVSNE